MQVRLKLPKDFILTRFIIKDVKNVGQKNEDVVIKRSSKSSKKPIDTKIIALCVLVLILVMAIGAVFSNVAGKPLINAGNTSKNGAIIYGSLPDSIRKVESFSSGAVLLTDTAVEYIDMNGKKLSTNSHLYSQPVIKTNKSTVLLYDKGGTSFRVEKNTSIYNTYTVSGTITTAALGAKDNYAYVLNNDGGYQSHLFVYSYQGKKQFEWGSASDYCIGTALSDNGKSVAVAMLGVKNGEYVSKIIFFNFKDSEPLYSVEFSDCTVYQLDFINNKTIAALTDNGIFVINNDGQSDKVLEYLPTEIVSSNVFRSGLKVFGIAQHGNSKESKVSVYDKKYEQLYSLDFDCEVFGVKASKNNVAVLLGDKINIYDRDNNKTAEIILGEKCFDAVFSGSRLFVQTLSGIYSFDCNKNIDLTLIEETDTTKENITEVSETENVTTDMTTNKEPETGAVSVG